jgi:hypothetical protein
VREGLSNSFELVGDFYELVLGRLIHSVRSLLFDVIREHRELDEDLRGLF